MAQLNTLTRDNILDAIAECDRLGTADFLKTHGYQASKRYQVRHGGRSYPSKAIVGVAAGLAAADFFGGVAQTVPALQRLGFECRDGRRVVTAVGLAAIAEQLAGETQAPHAWPNLPAEPAAYFASGSNRVGEIRGLAAVGHDVGVAVPELNEKALAELEALAGSDVQVFADSGAFGEVTFDPAVGGCVVVKPITDAEWVRRLAIYRRLAIALGSQVWIVAPDRVGDQATTLARLERYRDQVVELHELGARVLLPAQRGDVSQAEFYRQACDVLGFAPVPALPCKKAATSPAEAAAFVAEIEPAHVHLLGCGPRNRQAAEFVAAVASTSFSFDSNWITANVGRDGRRPRRYTYARDLARRVFTDATLNAELAVIVALGVAVLAG